MFDETLPILTLLLTLRAFQECHRRCWYFRFLLFLRVMFVGSNVSIECHLVFVIISTHLALEIESLCTYLIIFHLLFMSTSAFLCISLIYVTGKNMLVLDNLATLTFKSTFLKLASVFSFELNFLLRFVNFCNNVLLFTTFHQSL